MANGLSGYFDDEELNPAPLTEADILRVQQQGTMTPAMPLPSVDPRMQKAILEDYEQQMKQAAIEQQGGIRQLEKYIKDYQAKEPDIDWTPLAAFADYIDPQGRGKALEVAKLLKPETKEQRDAKTLALQGELQKRREQYTKNLMEPLLAQLRGQATGQAIRGEYLDLAKKKFGQQMTEKYGEKVGAPATDFANSLKEFEGVLGFKLNDYDPATNTVNGKPMADLPGVSIPGVGRLAVTPDASRLKSSISRIFNIELKDRSGAAVTNNELERLKLEFGQGQFNTESQMIEAAQRYKRLMEQELAAREAAYAPEIREQYKAYGGKTVKESFGDGQPSAPPSDKMKRLQELREKAKGG